MKVVRRLSVQGGPAGAWVCIQGGTESKPHLFHFMMLYCSLINVCFNIFSSIIPPHCIVFFHLRFFVLKVRMSPLFIKGFLT